MSTDTPQSPEVSTLSYEAARDELRRIVQALETGSAPLEETLQLWQRGEDLAKHCRQILENAQRKIEAASSASATAEASEALQ